MAAIGALTISAAVLVAAPAEARPVDRSDTGQDPSEHDTQRHRSSTDGEVGTTQQALQGLGDAEPGIYWAADEPSSQQPGSVRKQWPIRSWSCTESKTGEVADGSIQQQLDPVTVWPRNGASYTLRLSVVPRINSPDADGCNFFLFLPQFNLGAAVADAPSGAAPMPRCYQGDAIHGTWTKSPCHAERVSTRPDPLGHVEQEWAVISDLEPGRSRAFPGFDLGTGIWQIYLPVQMHAGRSLGIGRSFSVPGCESFCTATSNDLNRHGNEWSASIAAVFKPSDPPVRSQLRQVQEVWANPRTGDVAARLGGLAALGQPKSVGLSESVRWRLEDFINAAGMPTGHAYLLPSGWLIAKDTDPNGGHFVSWESAGWWLTGLFRSGPWLGWPTSDATDERGELVQHFEHGATRGKQVCVDGAGCTRGITPPLFGRLR